MFSLLSMKFVTIPDGAVAMSSANGLVATRFATRYRLQPIAGRTLCPFADDLTTAPLG